MAAPLLALLAVLSVQRQAGASEGCGTSGLSLDRRLLVPLPTNGSTSITEAALTRACASGSPPFNNASAAAFASDVLGGPGCALFQRSAGDQAPIANVAVDAFGVALGWNVTNYTALGGIGGVLAEPDIDHDPDIVNEILRACRKPTDVKHPAVHALWLAIRDLTHDCDPTTTLNLLAETGIGLDLLVPGEMGGLVFALDGTKAKTSTALAHFWPSSVRYAVFMDQTRALLGVAILPFMLFEMDRINEAFLLCVMAAMLLAAARGMSLNTILDGFVTGCRNMTIGAIVLGLAVTLGAVSRDLGTATWVVQAIADTLPRIGLPAILMLLCMGIAFSTGTSWGTYAVVFPVAMPLAYALDPDPLYVQLCFGAVLGGAVFGDQCSPISDTTILSSMFTGCDLMDHVKSQIPLALAAAGLAGVVATALAAAG